MEKLEKTIVQEAGKHATRINAALAAKNLKNWEDLSNLNALAGLREYLQAETNSASVYCATLSAIIGRYQDQLPQLPREWRKALNCKASKSQQTYLTLDDIRKLVEFMPRTATEKFVQVSALIELRTGTRISDAKDLDERNIVEGMLCYISKKTKTEAFVPCSESLLNLLSMRRAMNHPELTDEGYNKCLKRICGDCGITDEIKLFRRGEFREEEKSDATTSHTMRRTFCTQLHLAGEDVIDIMAWAGHSSVEMTRRYIRAHRKPGTPRYNFFDIYDKMINDKYGTPAVGGNSNSLSNLTPVATATL